VAPSPRRPRPPLPKRLAAAATNQLPLKLAALFFSFVLWLAVSAEEPTDEWVPVRVSVVTDSAVSLSEPVPPVRAFVIGRGRELLKLYVSEPTVHRTIDDGVRDSVTIPLKPSDVTLPAWVDADVREIDPSSITLHFNVTVTRKVPVRSELRLRVDSGWRIVGDPRFDPESVTVHGTRQAMRSVGAIPTAAQEFTVRDTSSQMVPLDAKRFGVQVEPEMVRVSVPAVYDVPVAPADSAAHSTASPKPAAKGRVGHAHRGEPQPPTDHPTP
jgi:hypothetical protein